MLSQLCAAIGSTWALPFENQFILWLQSLGQEGSFIYYLFSLITLFGEETILVGVVGFIYWGLDKQRGEKAGFMLMSATLLNPMVKNVVRRTRPFDSNPVMGDKEILNLKDVDGYSFPSGHSSGSASTFFGVAVTYKDKKQKWLWAIGIAIPVLVALSRNYLGAHYITDVVCGLALGVGVVYLVDFLYKIIPNKYYMYCGLLVLGLAGFFYCTTKDFFTGYGILLGFVCGIFFEERVTKFENTRVWWRLLLRVAVGGGLFVGLNSVIKAVVGLIYPTYEDNVWFEHIFRVLRYGTVVFLLIGVYPMLFAVCDKLWKKLGWIKTPAEQSQPIAE